MKKKLFNVTMLAFSGALFISNTNAVAQKLGSSSNSSIYICDDGKPNYWGGSGVVPPDVFTGFAATDSITDVSFQMGTYLFLRSDSTLLTYGSNAFGQTGHVTGPTAPQQITGHTGITEVGGGFYHSFFVKDDNTVWGFGRNDKGQLGDGNITGTGANPTPVQVLISDVVQVKGGFFHSIFLKSDSTVWQCGRIVNNVSTPVQFAGLSGVVSIAAGQYFSLFLKNDGTVWVCGNNQYGQFGNGATSTNDTNVPVQIAGLSGIVSIAAGDAFSIFVKNDGTVWACGRNSNGQLGDGTMVDKTSPVQVSGITNVIGAAGGWKHSVFLKSDSTVWACGYNLLGQLGDGTNVDKSTPVQVLNLCVAPPAPAVPAAPSNLTATPTNSIVLTWQDNATDEDGFYVESTQDTVGGTWTQIASLGPDVITYTHSGLTPGQEYFYRVLAYNSNGNSTFSNIAGATEPQSVGIAGIDAGFNAFTVYPNPNNGIVTVVVKGNEDAYELIITDLVGKTVWTNKNQPAKSEINLMEQVNGIYFIQLKTQGGILNKKIIINK